MHPVAIGGLDQDIVRFIDQGRIPHDGPVRPADITRKQDGPFLAILTHFYLDDRRAQNVARVAKSGFHARTDRDGRLVRDVAKVWKTRLGIGHRIKRNNRTGTFSLFFFVPFLFVFGIFFLQLGRIQQDDSGNFRRGVSAIDFAFKSLLDQLRQETAMIQVGMSQQDGIDTLGRHRKRLPVSIPKMPFLIESAIDEKPCTVGLEKMTRARHVLSGAEEHEF